MKKLVGRTPAERASHEETGARHLTASLLQGLGVALLAGVLLLAACRSQPAEPVPTPTGATRPIETAVLPTATEAPVVPTATGAPTSASATPAADLAAAPVPQAPEDGANQEGPVTLSWAWEGELQADEYYEVRLWAEGQEPKAIAWEKGFSFAVQGLPAGSYHWSVAVVREAGTQADGSKKWEAVSQVSQVLTFGHFPTTTSYSASLRHPPTALQLGKTGALLGLGLVLGLFLVPAGPGWLRHCRRRR